MLFDFWSFIGGILTGFIANYLFKRYEFLKNTKPLKSMEGYWLEYVPSQTDRVFSIGKFYLNDFVNEFQYDGTNYYNNGEEYYNWNSSDMIYDLRRCRISYMYTVNDKAANDRHGFGGIELEKSRKGGWFMKRGYFLDAWDERNPKHVVLIRLDRITEVLQLRYKLNYNPDNDNDHRELIKEIYKKQEDLLKKYLKDISVD